MLEKNTNFYRQEASSLLSSVLDDYSLLLCDTINSLSQEFNNHQNENIHFSINVKRLHAKYVSDFERLQVAREFANKNSRASGYTESWSWLEKIKFILVSVNKVMTLNEIENQICVFEPNLIGVASARKLRSNLSGILKIYTDRGTFRRTNQVNGNLFHYGLSRWFVDGLPNEQYLSN